MKKNKLIFRHEIKYLINQGEEEIIKQKLRDILRLDKNAVNGGYHVRSLYFDDYWDTAFLDKLNGFPNRKKYRIRVYDVNSNIINLECKVKIGAYINKQSARLTLDEYNKILNGDYGFLLKRQENVCQKFYYELTSRVIRPKVYVDYEREPYVMDEGTVRITLDKNVRYGSPCFDMFDRDMPTYHVLEAGKLVIEIKYTEFLPQLVKDMLAENSSEMSAVSKYTLCCDRVNYLSAKQY